MGSAFAQIIACNLIVIKLLVLVMRFACQIHTQFTESIHVNLGQDHAGVDLGTSQVLQLLHSCLGGIIRRRTDGECNQRLVRMQSGIAVSEVVHLQILNRTDGCG